MIKLPTILYHTLRSTCGRCRYLAMLKVVNLIAVFGGLRLSKFSVSRILQDMDAASEKLAKWGFI